jgi:hypothetical protein
MEWKWTKGEPYERSRRINNSNNNKVSLTSNSDENSFLYSEKTNEDLALSYSLNHDENTWEILNQSFNGFRQENKRADTDKRLAERQMIAQVNMNPYLVNNNYINDIETHDNFMKPQSTNLDREKGNGNGSEINE